MNKQKKFSRALKKQSREIQKLKKETFRVYEGIGKSKILSFKFSGFRYLDGATDTQQKIDDGHYESIEKFDATHTADIEFIDLYVGKDILKYRNQTKNNLVELGQVWRERVSKEHPDVDVTIILHQDDGEWFLDTFNYPIKIEDGIYL